MNSLIVLCRYCDWKGKLEDFQPHLNNHECRCEYCSKSFSTKNELNDHIDVERGDCPMQPIICPYSAIGCVTQTPVIRSKFEAHLKENAFEHLRLMETYVLPRLKESENQLHKIMGKNNQASSNSLSIIPEATNSNSIAKTTRNVEELQSKLKSIDVMQNDLVSKLNTFTISYDQLVNKLSKANQDEMFLRKEIETLQKDLLLHQVNSHTLHERLKAYRDTTFNGTLIWKISKVAEKIQASKIGTQTSFYSPPFYTSQIGYKMCARVYLNGDGAGRNTHLSVFLVILKGEYDDLLSWPFKQKVTFTLIDRNQTESRENVTDSFKPDPQSNSFQKPVNDMNIASGIPQFCSLSKLNSSEYGHIKDDTLYIRITVDCRGIQDI